MTLMMGSPRKTRRNSLWISLSLLGHASTLDSTTRSPRDFSLLSASDIAETVDLWGKQYPNLLRVFTAQDEYGLSAAGSESDCPFDENVVGCLNRVMVLQDFVAHPLKSTTAQRLPHVLWSGELHGNERVGPTAVMEATKLLLEAASCEGLPGELQGGSSCRAALQSEYGLTDPQRQWMARLVTTRQLVIVPTANALGYFRNTREEDRLDPNRDFPFDSDSECMQTIAARTLNEVFRSNMFQLSLTFHGGMEIIGYEWGSPHYVGATSPDDQAQREIAKAYSDFAGEFPGSIPFKYGTMNDEVYPISGGMEDWAYAGSWDPERVIPCNPRTYGGYSASKTMYSDSTLRCYNMLIETSNSKTPTSSLGGSTGLVGVSAGSNGHVARNARLALMALELVEPYLTIRGADSLVLSDDLVPLAPHTCRQMALPGKQGVPIIWSVGGALTVEETELYILKEWNDSMSFLCNSQPPNATSLLSTLIPTSAVPLTGTSSESFQRNVDLSSFRDGDVIALMARARVDRSWQQGQPKAHIVHSRREPTYQYEAEDGSVLQGRIDWFSQPLLLRITSAREPSPNPTATPTDGRQEEFNDGAEGTFESSADVQCYYYLLQMLLALVALLANC